MNEKYKRIIAITIVIIFGLIWFFGVMVVHENERIAYEQMLRKSKEVPVLINDYQYIG